jgi:hypothetical protein
MSALKRTTSACLVLLSLGAWADEFVTPAPTPTEVARFTVARTQNFSAKLDSMTGATWYLCASTKTRGRSAWCRFREISGLASGPAGRYRLNEGTPLILLDTVSGRSWTRCDVPTPEKGEAWCQVEE